MSDAESVAPVTPRPEDLEAALKKIQVVDISEAIGAHAIDAADDYLSRETSQKGVGGFVKRIFKGNLVRDVIRQRQIHKGRQQIIESGNIYTLQGGDQAEHDQAVAAVVERFTSDYDLLHRQAGETNEQMDGALLDQLKQLISEFAHNGAMSIEALEEAKNRVLHDYGRRVHADDRNKGLMYADNIIEVAQQARFAAEHELARERIEAALSGHIGEAKVGVRTEARLQATDKALDWLHKHHMSAVNEGTLGLGLAIAMTAVKVTSRSALSAAAKMAVPGIGAGLIAGAREHLRVGQERTLHMRQMAEGGEMPADHAHRREKMEEARYETVAAAELTSELEGVGELLENGSLLEAIAAINAAEVRIGMSDQRNIDLISYSSKTGVEQERFMLDMRLAEAKVLLQRKLNDLDDETFANLGFGSRELAAALSAHTADLEENILGDLSEKDHAFRKLRRNRTLKMAAIGAALGVTLGAAFQEGHALLDGDLRGVFEGSGGNRQSLLSALLRHAHHPSSDQHREFFEGGHHFKDTAVDLPPGYHLVQTNPGEKFGWQIQGPDGKNVLDHLNTHKFLEQMQGDHNQHHLHHINGDHLGVGFDTQGNLDYESREALRSLGFDLHQHAVGFKEPRLVTHDVTRNIHEYLRAHPHDFVRAHRELWYDNNTPGIYDQNELKLDWGANGVGMDSHGNYVLNVASMMPDGSFHEGLSTNAQQLVHEGKMAIALSMSRDTQHFVHLVPIDKNGNAVIKADSFLGHSLFQNQDGHARFIGGYAEAAQLMGKTPDGGESIRMLATVVGENHPHSATDQITRLVTEHHTHYVTDIEAPKSLPIEVPPVIPLYSRKGLENLERYSGLRNMELAGTYYGGSSLSELQEWIAADPSRLKTRREVKDGSRKKWVEADGSEVKRETARERDSIKNYLDKEKVRDPAHYELVEKVASSMSEMSDDCRVAVNVPAWMEAKNLRNFLEQYTAQKDKDGNPLDIKSYEINILVNRKTGSEADNSVEVIEQFIKDFEEKHGFKPSVNYYDVELNPPHNNVGYARKLLTDAVILRSLQRESQNGALYIETEDADMVTIDPRTVERVIAKLDSNPQLDAVRGIQDRAPEYMKDNDMLFLRRRAWDFLERLASDRRLRDPSNPRWNFTWNRTVTGGWNTAYTAEAYALIEGYDSVVAGEDMSVGERISMVRGDGTKPNLEVVGRVTSRSDSSPRRFINEIRTNRGAYIDFGDESDNQTIREGTIEESLETISHYRRMDESNKDEFAGFIDFVYRSAGEMTPDEATHQQIGRRLLFFLGFHSDDYEITPEGHVQIKNWDNVQKALDNYRERYAQRALAQIDPLYRGVTAARQRARRWSRENIGEESPLFARVDEARRRAEDRSRASSQRLAEQLARFGGSTTSETVVNN